MVAMERYIDTFALKKKIAILDTGINIDFHDFNKKNIEIIDLTKDKSILSIDLDGHGTSCCGEVVKYYSNASIIAIPILNEARKCSLADLYNALLYCYQKEDIGIINMSVACIIEDSETIAYFEKLVNQIWKSGRILIASNMNRGRGKRVYPYSFSNVIGVNHTMSNSNYIEFDKLENNIMFYGGDCIMPGKIGEYAFFSGCSSYAAKLTGLIGYEIANSKIKKLSIEELLSNCNKRLKMLDKKEKKQFQYVDESLENTISWLIDSVYNQGSVDYKKEDINERLARLNRFECVKLLSLIEEKIKQRIDFKKFSVYDFDSINKLASKVNYCIDSI